MSWKSWIWIAAVSVPLALWSVWCTWKVAQAELPSAQQVASVSWDTEIVLEWTNKRTEQDDWKPTSQAVEKTSNLVLCNLGKAMKQVEESQKMSWLTVCVADLLKSKDLVWIEEKLKTEVGLGELSTELVNSYVDWSYDEKQEQLHGDVFWKLDAMRKKLADARTDKEADNINKVKLAIEAWNWK